MSSLSLRPLAFLLLASSGLVACSSDNASAPSSSSTSTGGTSSGAPPVSTADCQTRCKAKAATCPGAGAGADQGCTQLCASSVTEEQLSCLEEKSCSELASAEDFDSICPKSSTSSTSSSSTSSSSSSSGSSGGPYANLPTSLKITGHFGSVKAQHVKKDLTLVSVLSVAPKPSFSPSQPATLPDVTDKGVTATVTSPDLGSCPAKISYVLNSNQIGVMITGTETLPATDCATFTDAVAEKGFKATLSNVPYTVGSTKATVTIDISP